MKHTNSKRAWIQAVVTLALTASSLALAQSAPAPAAASAATAVTPATPSTMGYGFNVLNQRTIALNGLIHATAHRSAADNAEIHLPHKAGENAGKLCGGQFLFGDETIQSLLAPT